jgi:hypothetical protein
MICCFWEICSSKTNTFRKYFDGRSGSNNLSGIYPLVIIKDLQVVQRFPNLRSGNKKSRTLPTMHVTGRKKISVSTAMWPGSTGIKHIGIISYLRIN